MLYEAELGLYTYLIVTIIGMLYLCLKQEWHWIASLIFSGLSSILITALIIFGFVLIDQKTVEVKYVKYCNIYSLKTTDVVSGTFTLGSGKIEQVEYYYFLRKNGNSEFVRGKSIVENTSIVESDSEHPNLKRKHKIYESRSGWIKWVEGKTDEYRIVIPTGSVTHDYSIK